MVVFEGLRILKGITRRPNSKIDTSMGDTYHSRPESMTGHTDRSLSLLVENLFRGKAEAVVAGN